MNTKTMQDFIINYGVIPEKDVMAYSDETLKRRYDYFVSRLDDDPLVEVVQNAMKGLTYDGRERAMEGFCSSCFDYIGNGVCYCMRDE